MSDAFRIVPGDHASSVIIHVPHSSRVVPDDVRADIMLDDAALARELNAMTDAFTDVIAERAAERVTGERPWLFVNGLSRLVVDPERFPDEREEMNVVGMGAVYTKTSGGFMLRDLPHSEINTLVDRFFTPYSAALANLVDERLSSTGTVTIIDLHSYPLVPNPYELHAGGPRPEVCLGTDEFHSPPELLEAARAALISATPTGDIGEDSPFSGCYVPLKHHRSNDRVRALMIELRRDLYMDDLFGLVEGATDPLAVQTSGRLLPSDLWLAVQQPQADLSRVPEARRQRSC